MTDDGGIGRLQRRLAAIPKAVKDATQPALLKQGGAMAGTMRQFVAVDTGDTKASITVTPAGQQTPPYSQPGGSMTVPENAVAITVGNQDVRTAHLLEYGTAKAPAQPFFWPAVRLHQNKAKAAIKRAVGTAVKKNWGSP
ncbi:MAG: HK97-gp10 family putative phage morphogenesis protein [Devosia sp.]